MKDAPIVLLDACVLIPMPLADTLLRLGAAQELFLPKWSDEIMAEVSRSLQKDFGLSAEKAIYREREMRRHFPEARIDGYEDLIPALTNHPKDRHVLAAAVRGGARVIVTYNIRDFPHSSLEPHSIEVQGPSTFLKMLYRRKPATVTQTLEGQAAAIGQTMAYLLSRLRVNAPGFVAAIEQETIGDGDIP